MYVKYFQYLILLLLACYSLILTFTLLQSGSYIRRKRHRVISTLCKSFGAENLVELGLIDFQGVNVLVCP